MIVYQLFIISSIILITVILAESSPTNGFIDFDLMVNKARREPRLDTLLESNELRIVSDLTFNCTGVLTSMIIGVEVRRGDLLRNQYPQLQLWRPQGDLLHRVESRDIDLTPNDFNSRSVYEFKLNPPLSFMSGDVLGIYQPVHSRSLVRVYYVDNIDTPVQSFNDSTTTEINTVNLTLFESVRESLLIFPFTDPPMCSVGFLDMDTVISISRNTQPVIRSGGFQRIFPNINFVSNGSITKWIVGGEDILIGSRSNFPELQVWRLIGPQFIKIGASNFSTNVTTNTNIHVMYPSPPIDVQAGDIFGIFTPFDLGSSLSVLFQRFNGPANRIMINLSPPAPTVLPNNCLPEFYFGENQYPLVSVEMQTILDRTSISLSSTTISISTLTTTTIMSSLPTSIQSTIIVSPTGQPNTQPITDIILYVSIGAVAGVVATIVIVIITIVFVCLCVRLKNKNVRSAPQNSLRDNPCYGNRDSNGSDSICTSPQRVDSIMYETIDVQTSLHNNPSYTTSSYTSSLDA